MRASGPSTGPTACALAGRRCSLWGWRKGVPGAGAFYRCEGRLRSGAPPPPTARLPGGLSGSITHVLSAGVCGCGGSALSPWLACPCGGCMPRGWWGAVPGGCGLPLLGVASGVRCCPSSAARSLGRAVGVPRPVCPGCGGCGRGDPAPVPQRAPLRASLACCGDGGRASRGGGAFRRCEGRLRSGAPSPPTARPLGALSGSATHVLWALVCGCGGPALSPWLACPVRAACRGVGGGPSPGGWPATAVRGVWCQTLSLPRLPVLWGGQPGFRDLCVPGAVGAGVGTQHWPLQRAPLRAGVARVGRGGRASPGGLPFAVVRGV